MTDCRTQPGQTGRPFNPTPARPTPTDAIAPDCRHYHGDRPCFANRLCGGCEAYEPYANRIVVIKLGALGDVVRTLCILPELRRLHPHAQITWVSEPAGCRMIHDHPMIDRVLPFDALNALALTHEAFDVAINLDKEPQPCALMMSLSAGLKLGVGLSPHGTPVPLNDEAVPYFHLGLSDVLKFERNRKTYPQLIYEALGLNYTGQRYELPVNAEARESVRADLLDKGWSPSLPTLAVNVGAGPRFANKMWPAEKTAALIQQLGRAEPGLQVLLIGGLRERSTADRIEATLEHAGCRGRVFDGVGDHDEPTFVALVDLCDGLFSGDTMALHVAVARDKPVVAFFGPTCEQEIDLPAGGEKLIAKAECGPCYKRTCDHADVCIDRVSIEETVHAIQRTILRAGGTYRLRVVPLRQAG